MLRAERATAMRARVAVMVQVRAILVTAPKSIRAKYRAMTSPALMAALERTRPAGPASEPLASTATVLKRLAVRYRHLHHELAQIDAELDAILAFHAPMLRERPPATGSAAPATGKPTKPSTTWPSCGCATTTEPGPT